MIVRSEKVSSHGVPPPKETGGTNVWLFDAFGYTPWYSVALVKAMSRAGASVRFLAPKVACEPEYFAQQGVTSAPGPFPISQVSGLPAPLGKFARLLAVTANAAALRWQLRHVPEKRPDIIHFQQLPALNHGLQDDFRTITCAQRAGVPVVHTVHNLLPHDSGSRLREIYQRLYWSVDHLICHSPDVAEQLSKAFVVNAQNITVVPHGPLFEALPARSNERAHARRHLNIAPTRPVALWQGIMAPYKGVDVLLQAWEQCIQEWPDATALPLLLIAGIGSAGETAAVKAAVDRSPTTVRAEIRYITTAELPLFFQAADLLVYPYRAITTSGALLTGLSYGKPIVASDLPPFRQYLRHNENALLVAPGDVSALAEALRVLMLGVSSSQQSRSIYSSLLTGASHNRQRYTSWDTIAHKTLALYGELIHAK
jgi:glycosyltransferase involved in cell wall biosynthesis